MPLSHDAALRKDARAPRTLEHRHFATIAAILADLPKSLSLSARYQVLAHFAEKLAETNPNFDRDRFLRACGAL